MDCGGAFGIEERLETSNAEHRMSNAELVFSQLLQCRLFDIRRFPVSCSAFDFINCILFTPEMNKTPKSEKISRRSFIQQSGVLSTGMALIPELAFSNVKVNQRSAMGVAAASYANRWGSGDASKKIPGFENALQMLVHCESIGAGGVQVGARNWSEDFTGKVREFRERKELYLEGSIQLPQNHADVDRFEVEARNSMEAGASILRTACLSGRRYENFESGQAFEEFKAFSIKSIERAAHILARYKLKLAIENHKDWRVPDLLALIKYFDSEWIGINLDTGNNISFLEDPMYVVESLAPYSFTTHIKDMGVKDYEDGFLLSEVPLGTGALDLGKIIDVCRQHNPGIKFNLEMITRNPLEIPCYKEEYWATFEKIPAVEMVGALQWVRDHQSALPSVKGMSPEEKLSFEEKNIIDSFKYAHAELKL